MSKNPNPPTGWLCPNCGVTWAPWVISCECNKEEGEMVEMVVGERLEPPCLTLLKLCPDADQVSGDPAFHDVLIGEWARCDLACEGDRKLLPCLKHLPDIEDDAPSSPLPEYIKALRDLRDNEDFVQDLDMDTETKTFLRKHPWAAAQVRDSLDRLADTEDVEALEELREDDIADNPFPDASPAAISRWRHGGFAPTTTLRSSYSYQRLLDDQSPSESPEDDRPPSLSEDDKAALTARFGPGYDWQAAPDG
jgi:hypothetical protein